MKKIISAIISLSILSVVFSCKRDAALKVRADYHGYPEEVGKIIVTKCATSGCHDDITRAGEAQLSLSSWEKMFEGEEGGAVVIPYQPLHSSLFIFTNTFSDLGISAQPTMPYNASPLSKEEVTVLKNWIQQGAPDNKGFVKFSDNTARKKIYVTNQGCDGVTVFDAETKLAMRYIDVGKSSANIESPHMLKVAPDRKYWYVIFTAGTVIQKFDAANDNLVGEITIGNGNWNTFTISPDSRMAYIVDWSSDGSIAKVDLENMTLLNRYQGSGLFFNPHGIAANSSFNTLYVTAQIGNFIYKIDTTEANFSDYKQIMLDEQPISFNPSLNPHEIIFTPDGGKYFVTCMLSNEVRAMQTSNDSLLAVIQVGNSPAEMSLSKTHPYLFVTCMETTCADTLSRGSVAVIDYTSLNKIKEISCTAFFQPHGLAVDDESGVVYVASRNVAPGGPAPHHTSICGGKNGFISIIDIITLEVIDEYRTEISVDPYSVAFR